MKLYPKDYEAPSAKAEVAAKTNSEPRAAQAKALIEAFVADKPQYHTDIIDHLKKEMGLGGLPNVMQLIADVEAEWHPPKAVEDEVLDEPGAKK